MRAMRILLAVLLGAAAVPPLTAQRGLPTWRATAVWRIDGTESGEPFADVRDYVVSTEGTLWLLEAKDQLIRRFDGNGKALATAGRKGSGPGEMRRANGLLVRRDGSVWVNDPGNGRLSEFSATGTFTRQHLAVTGGYGWRWNGWMDRRTGDLIDEFLNAAAKGESQWRRWTAAGAIRDTVPMPACAIVRLTKETRILAETKGKGNMVTTYPFATGGGSTPDGAGNVWCASPASTRVARVRIGAQDTVFQTRVELPRIVIGKSERDEEIAKVKKMIAEYATSDFDPAKVPTLKSGIDALTVDDDGRLWVRHAHVYGGTTVTFDVHNPSGKHLARVLIPQRPGPTWLPVRARGNDVWIAVRDADDILSIARYRLSNR